MASARALGLVSPKFGWIWDFYCFFPSFLSSASSTAHSEMWDLPTWHQRLMKSCIVSAAQSLLVELWLPTARALRSPPVHGRSLLQTRPGWKIGRILGLCLSFLLFSSLAPCPSPRPWGNPKSHPCPARSKPRPLNGGFSSRRGWGRAQTV